MDTFMMKIHSEDTTQKKPALTRRELLRGSGILFGTIAASSPLALLAPSTAWAIELKKFDQQQGETLMHMAQILFPHKKLPDAVYAILAKDLDKDAAKDESQFKLLKNGINALNLLADGNFSQSSKKRQLEAMKSLEGQAFFNTVRGKCVVSLYDNELAFKALGYPGSAWEKGGYITRGFQDLKWLPNPPASASPAPYLG
jgi:hypothetical protein